MAGRSGEDHLASNEGTRVRQGEPSEHEAVDDSTIHVVQHSIQK